MIKKPKSGLSLRIDTQPADRQERLNKWLSAQSNNTQSIFNLIDHMIDRFGYEDVTSHEINKKLYLERINFEQTVSRIVAPSLQPVQPIVQVDTNEATAQTTAINDKHSLETTEPITITQQPVKVTERSNSTEKESNNDPSKKKSLEPDMKSFFG